MKKFLLTSAIALLMTAGLAVAGGPAPKYTVLHNGQTICVSENALPAHKAHRDMYRKGCPKKIIIKK